VTPSDPTDELVERAYQAFVAIAIDEGTYTEAADDGTIVAIDGTVSLRKGIRAAISAMQAEGAAVE
jgi:hypothetical protein